MKNFKLLYLVFIGTMFIGCKKFLDLPPKNQRAVSTLQDVKSVLAGYLNGVGVKQQRPIVGAFPLFTALHVMMFEAYSDNIDFAANMSKFVNPMNLQATEAFYANFLLWNLFNNDYDVAGEIWDSYYETIGFLNALIDEVQELKDGSPMDERNRLEGEMRVHRAFFFYKLLQYFGPYQNAELGIPVYLHSGKEVVGVPMPRMPQSEVYKTIINDLTTALDMIPTAAPVKGYNIFYNERYINNLLAQVYWFKAESAAKEDGDYAQAKKYSQEAIKNVAQFVPKTMNDINLAVQGLNLTYPAFYQEGLMYGEMSPLYGSTWDYLGFQPAGVQVASDLLDLYDPADIRRPTYFTGSNINSAWPDGRAFGYKYVHYLLFQPEEAYLILAEAQYHLGETDESVNTLNEFKSFRNAGSATGLSGEQLYKEIQNERRKEFFANSDKRWIDLKRYGNKTITRSLRFFNKDYNVTVAPNDFHYALSIPLTELQENPQIIQNEGWVPILF